MHLTPVNGKLTLKNLIQLIDAQWYQVLYLEKLNGSLLYFDLFCYL